VVGGGGGGVLAKSLRRTRSGLKLFGGGLTGTRSREATVDSFETGGEAVYGGGGGVWGTGANSSTLDLASTSPTPTSAVFPTGASSSSNTSQQLYHPHASSSSALSPYQQPHNPLSGRIGGWFSSMIPRATAGGSTSYSASSSSTHLPLDPEQSQLPSSAHSSPDKSRRAPASSSSPGGYRLSPKKGSTSSAVASSPSGGRLGVFDRVLDRAAQYFFDSDSRADECEDEIWVLGVCHPGFTPVVAIRESSGEEVEDEEGEGGAAGEGGKAKKRKSLPSLGRKSRSPVKQRKGGPPPRPPVPALPSSVGGVVDPFVVPSTPSTASSFPSSVVEPSAGSLPFTSSPSPSDVHPSHPPSFASLDSLPPTIHGWPSSFYHDFYSRIALTYRTGFPAIPCSPSSSQAGHGGVGGVLSSLGASMGRGGRTGISDVKEVGGEGLSSDTGWGCMLRTGQSLLANALMVVHLGRGSFPSSFRPFLPRPNLSFPHYADWRRPLPLSAFASASSSSTHLPLPFPSSVADPATYSRLLSLFLDTPLSPSLSPFSVHAFALEGKKLGKHPGEWFGPSTAAGAIKVLVNAYEPAGLRVVSCVDGTVYESEVKAESEGWKKPVLVLVNVRLGIDGVNPIYHEAIKVRFLFDPPPTTEADSSSTFRAFSVSLKPSASLAVAPLHPTTSSARKQAASSTSTLTTHALPSSPLSLHLTSKKPPPPFHSRHLPFGRRHLEKSG
jgi:hypothetical protein